MRITVPDSAAYAIGAPETVTLTIPAAAISTRLPQPVVGTVVINATAGTLGVGGRLIALDTEASLRDTASPQELELVLTDDTWAEATLLSGGRMTEEAMVRISSDGSDATGWDAIVGAALGGVSAELTSPTTLKLSLPPFPTYDISTPETLSVFVPPAAVLSRQPIRLAPAFAIRAKAGVARVGGTLLLSALKGTFVNVSDAFRMTLDILQDTSGPFETLHAWHPCIGTPCHETDLLIDYLRALRPELGNATLLNSYPESVDEASEHFPRSFEPLNYSQMALHDNFTVSLYIPVPRDFDTAGGFAHNETVRDGLSSYLFARNLTRPVQLVIAHVKHVEEVATGTYVFHNDEAALASPARTPLSRVALHPPAGRFEPALQH